MPAGVTKCSKEVDMEKKNEAGAAGTCPSWGRVCEDSIPPLLKDNTFNVSDKATALCGRVLKKRFLYYKFVFTY